MPTPKKDTFYIDVEDDITAIIDKVNTSTSKIIAIVLPKRAQMLHSSVNMRLLKRAADNQKKRLVLITNESTILTLAGTVGLFTAKSLTSKPVIPAVAHGENVTETVTLDSEALQEDTLDTQKSIGELAAAAGLASAVGRHDETEETIELDNAPGEESETSEVKTAKEKKNRKLVVPNFDRFRLKLFGGIGLLVILGVLGFLMFFVWPRATIVITTETSRLDSKFDFAASVAINEFDREQSQVPATVREVKQTARETIVPTGSKDIGNRSKGFVTLTNCDPDDEPVTLPQGTRLVVGDAAFLTDAEVTLPSDTTGSGLCKSPTRNVDVTAELGGDRYNLSARGGYTAPGFPYVTGFGSNMTGGTTNVVKVVSADDVESVKQKLLLRNTDEAKQQLVAQFKELQLYALPETFSATNVEPTSSPAVGEQADSATVSMEFTYTMLGIKESDLQALVEQSQANRFDPATERIYDDGVSKATVGVAQKRSSTDFTMTYTGSATAGPVLDAEAIAREVAGKPGGETKQIIEARPGISSAEVRYDPFYVFRTPTKISRINITFNVDGDIVQ